MKTKSPAFSSLSASLPSSWVTFTVAMIVTTGLGLISTPAEAKLSVVTTTTDLAAITREVAKDLASVEAIAKGTQDPHFIEAKPSFMVKVSRADLLISVGLDLEIGWLPSIVNGARNPKIRSGQPGSLEVGPFVSPLEVATGAISRAEGDVHPDGNPHVTLDPIRSGDIGMKIAERMGALDSANAAAYRANAEAFKKDLADSTLKWQERITKSGVKSAITYHKTLTYFLDRFKIANPAILEPKPGIPPTSGHIINVIDVIKSKKVPVILVENYFDPTVTKKIKLEVPSVRSEVVPVSVDGAPHVKTLKDLYEALVRAIEGGR